MFSQHTDMGAYQLFFECVKEAIGCQLEPEVFMSDCANSMYNAWKVVMKPAKLRLWCSWHVFRAWKEKLNSFFGNKSVEYKEMKAKLYTLRDAKTEDMFKIELKKFLKSLKSEKELLFKAYFETYYASDDKVALWAYCYRRLAKVNTNMHLENLHR